MSSVSSSSSVISCLVLWLEMTSSTIFHPDIGVLMDGNQGPFAHLLTISDNSQGYKEP
jgi:hypothetical protein